MFIFYLVFYASYDIYSQIFYSTYIHFALFVYFSMFYINKIQICIKQKVNHLRNTILLLCKRLLNANEGEQQILISDREKCKMNTQESITYYHQYCLFLKKMPLWNYKLKLSSYYTTKFYHCFLWEKGEKTQRKSRND